MPQALLTLYAETEDGPRVLFLRNNFVQTWVDRKQVAGRVPPQAGQWILPGEAVPVDQPAEGVLLDAFLQRSGIDLGDPVECRRYGLGPLRQVGLEDRSYRPFTVFYGATDGAGLERLATAIGGNLQRLTVVDGRYAAAKVMRQAEARRNIGPVLPPPEGWRSFLIKTYYGGKPPGQFNTEIDVLTRQLAERSQEDPAWTAIALEQIPGEEPPPPVDKGRLLRLVVEGAQKTGAEAYAADYAGAALTLTAVTEPDSPAVHERLEWSGVAAVGKVARLTLDVVTPPERPLEVAVRLGEQRLAVQVTVRPRLLGLRARNADFVETEDAETELFVADYDEVGPPVLLTALLEPDTPEALAHLRWSGGQPVGDDKGSRAVPRDRLAPPEAPLEVTAEVNPRRRAKVVVLPRVLRVEVANATAAGGTDYEIELQNGATTTLTAVTAPNSGAAHALVSWSTGAVNSNQIQVARHPIGVAGAFTDYTARIRFKGQVRSAATAGLLVVPTMVSLTADAYGFDAGGGNLYSYAAAGQLGLPANLALTATAATNPNTAQAWGHLVWAATSAHGASAASERLDLNAVVTASVQVGVIAASRRTLDLRPIRQWPASGLQLRIDRIAFAGGFPVIQEDPLTIGTPYPATWILGALRQSPLGYLRNTAIQITPTLGIPNPPLGNVQIDVRATAFLPLANGSYHRIVWTWNGQAVAAGAAVPIVLAQAAGNQNLPNEVVHGDPLYLFWEFREGVGAWTLFDATTHQLYVTLGAAVGGNLPGPTPARAYWTVLAWSCRAANGANNAAAFVQACFGTFAARNAATGANPLVLRQRDGGALTYWNPQPNTRQSLHQWLAAPGGASPGPVNGSCLAWSQILLCIYNVHGINSGHLVEVVPHPVHGPGAARFLVAQWAFNAPPAAQAAAYTHIARANGPPVGPNATWGPGVPGQNSPAPPPAFRNHYIVRETTSGDFYDPSYGNPSPAGPGYSPYTNWVTASIAGLERPRPPRPWWSCLLPCLTPPRTTAGYAIAAGATPNIVRLTDRNTGVNIN